MKLARFCHQGASRLGAVVDDSMVDLSSAAPELPAEMIALLGAGPAALARVRDAIERSRDRIPLSHVRLEAPSARPPEFLAIGLNYADHIAVAS